MYKTSRIKLQMFVCFSSILITILYISKLQLQHGGSEVSKIRIYSYEMDHFKPPNALNLDGNLKENWKRWRQRFELYLKASGAVSKDQEIQVLKASGAVSKELEIQVAILLHCVGEEALEVFNTFVFANDDDSKKLDPVLQAFENYCSPRKHALFDRFLFWKRVQKEGESVEQKMVKKL